MFSWRTWIFLAAIVCIAPVSCAKHDAGDDKPYLPDPLAIDQWYLANDSNYLTINLSANQFKGDGVLVALVDNGIDIYHEDLINNIGEGSYNYLGAAYDFTDADHGTACAGIIAAEEGNGIGIRGIAPHASVIGFNALRTPAISNLADALVRHKKRVWVSSNSWGDFNSWGEPLALRSLIEAALADGTTNGRDGKGIVYVFSAGNGSTDFSGVPTDNVNYSGLVNNRYTIPVCAVDEHGKRAPYSEKGATLIVCAPSRGSSGPAITTTDVTGAPGYNPKKFKDDYEDENYTRYFSGTSASAPIVSGIVALMLNANPRLGWRDVRTILARSASKIDAEDAGWEINGAGLHVNHQYGFGAVDADRAIDMAKSWINAGEEKVLSAERQLNLPIPDNDPQGIADAIDIDSDLKVEFVEVVFNAPDHTRIGDLEVILTSPSGTQSILAEKHTQLFEVFRYNNWRFGSARHLGENARGAWRLSVVDHAGHETGTLVSWELRVYGYAVVNTN